MSVTIDIKLSADGVQSRINSITAALEALDDAGKDIDLGEAIDADGITGQIGDLKKKLKELEDQMGNMSKRVKNDDFGIPEKVQHEHNVSMPDGSTGSGDSTGGDPPAAADGDSKGKGLNKRQIASKIEKLGGFDRGSVTLSENIDLERLNEVTSDLDHSIRDLTSAEYPWVSGAGDGNLGANQMSSKDIDALEWNELQQRASDAGVYTQNASKETLRKRLKSQQLGGPGIWVDTDSHGKMPLQQAREISSGARDIPVPGVEGESSSIKKLRAQQARLIEAAGLDPEAVAKGERDLVGDGTNPERWRQLNQEARREAGLTDGEVSRATRQGRGMPDFDQVDTPFRRGKSSMDIENMGEGLEGVFSKLRKFKPTMGKYMQIFAAIIPVAIALGVHLAGVAAAMGAVAAAGAGIIGLGLLGHAESMSGSFAQAKKEIKDLKKELFEVAQPAMQQFAPIQSRMFDAIPGALEGIFEEMEGLAGFESTLFSLGSALAGGLEKALEIINQNSEAISQLTTRFAGLIGSGLLKFFEWLIQSAYKNQDLIVQLGKAFMNLAQIAFDLSMIIASVVAGLQPLFWMVSAIASFLNNKFIIGILAAVTTFSVLIVTTWKLTTALYAAMTALAGFGSGGIISGVVGGITFMIGKIWGLITSLWSAVFASEALITALSALTLGAFAVGAGLAGLGAMNAMSGGPGSRGPGSGGKTVYNDNRNIQVNQMGDDYATQKAIGDEVNSQLNTKKAQSLPEVEMSSGNSDSEKDS